MYARMKEKQNLVFDEYVEKINASSPSCYEDRTIYQADNDDKSRHCTTR